jgi:hypothetical protein
MSRTTITLTPEADAAIEMMMRERGLSFKQAVNAAILDGAPPPSKHTPFKLKTHDVGPALVPLDHATTLVGELDDIEYLRKRDMGK